MFAFNLVRVDFADSLSRGGTMALLDASGIGLKVPQPNGFSNFCTFTKTLSARLPSAYARTTPLK
jgi:hypothetical protein